MGQRTEAVLAAFADETGIIPATGDTVDALNALSQCCFDLIKVVELERSGIRDGAGCWIGSDALEGTVSALNDAWNAYSLVFARTVRPGGGKRKKAAETPEDLYDRIPF